MFRNTWLPRRRADYISTLPVGKRSEVAAERDFNFGLEEKEEKEKEREEEGMINEPKGMKERVKSVAARMKLISVIFLLHKWCPMESLLMNKI